MILKTTELMLFLSLWYNRFVISIGDSTQELLIKNITQILDLLLQDYDNSQHPNYSSGRPTIIRTNMLIRSMGPISEFDMDFSMDCYFRQHWNDPRLRFRGPVENLSLNIKMLEKIWRPDTYFHNGKNSYVHTITLPNKLLRLSKDGDILYSMRLTIKAKCPMCLKNFPMDSQSCPLIIGSYAYTGKQILYEWQGEPAVSYAAGIGLALSQFDLISSPYDNFSLQRQEGEFSVLQVNFNLVRFAGYFLIQIYVPCILIVVLSFVGFFINREATSDRVGLGVTSILTLSTISLDTRNDLPKVHYATALDWFLIMSFVFVMGTLLEFASVHYFTKVGSGEAAPDEDDWDESGENVSGAWTSSGAMGGGGAGSGGGHKSPQVNCSIVYNDHGQYGWRSPVEIFDTPSKSMESKETQTEKRLSCFSQFLRCLVADETYRRERQRAAANEHSTNSVSKIDKISRVLFPVSFFCLNVFYWGMYSFLHDTCERKSHGHVRSGSLRTLH